MILSRAGLLLVNIHYGLLKYLPRPGKVKSGIKTCAFRVCFLTGTIYTLCHNYQIGKHIQKNKTKTKIAVNKMTELSITRFIPTKVL